MYKLLFFLSLLWFGASAQDTLPKFTVVNQPGNRVIISWTNPYGQNIRQISIQRSFDSLKNFRTILTVPDATAPQNGYADTKATNDHMFYRLYLLLDSNGHYLFSRSKRPAVASAGDKLFLPSDQNGIISLKKIEEITATAKGADSAKVAEQIIFIKRRDTLVGAIKAELLKRFRDSINLRTKDTVFMKSTDTLVIRSFVAKEVFRPSKWVYTEKDGNVKIALTDAGQRKYTLKFYEEDNTPLFEVSRLPDTVLILDKSNFIHSGWFNFELYEDGKLKERHKVYIPKEF
ncbi:MAG: hypothetical protein INR73_24635 [Williamsia sp.]|nr:hypothetical protein [Williamsia sp.]